RLSARPRGEGFGHPARRRQPPAEAVHADGKDDVQALPRRRQGPAAPDERCAEGHGRDGWHGRTSAALTRVPARAMDGPLVSIAAAMGTEPRPASRPWRAREGQESPSRAVGQRFVFSGGPAPPLPFLTTIP